MRLALFAGIGALLSGCDLIVPSPPPQRVLEQGMTESLMDTGFYRNVAVTQIIGRHYNPSERAWKLLACFDFTLQNGERGATCVDSFEAIELDTGAWAVSVTIDDVYRWRAISIASSSQGGVSATPAPPDPN
jgi:hypothetical protein